MAKGPVCKIGVRRFNPDPRLQGEKKRHPFGVSRRSRPLHLAESLWVSPKERDKAAHAQRGAFSLAPVLADPGGGFLNRSVECSTHSRGAKFLSVMADSHALVYETSCPGSTPGGEAESAESLSLRPGGSRRDPPKIAVRVRLTTKGLRGGWI